jgi:mannose-6-phosphate isomerase-like protein (cupin superfamily)
MGRLDHVFLLEPVSSPESAACFNRPMEIANLSDRESFVTADGSGIRELAGPGWTKARNQSLAEATVDVGGETAEHYHPRSEEIYYFTAGSGRMRLGSEEAEVGSGDCVVIPPGTVHKLWNTGDQALVLMCCCAPAYSHEDTILTGR